MFYLVFCCGIQNEIECAFYMRNGQCKFGSTCKFNHPQPANIIVSLLGSTLYPPIHSPTTGELSFARVPFVPKPRRQSPSSYAPHLMAQGVLSVPLNTNTVIFLMFKLLLWFLFLHFVCFVISSLPLGFSVYVLSEHSY